MKTPPLLHLLVVSLFAAHPASAQDLILNFGSISDPNFPTDLSIEYSNVATGINATLTANSAFQSAAAGVGNNGSAVDDLRVNVIQGDEVRLNLTLWDSDIGNGFESLYNPQTDFTWNMMFYDIDGQGNGTDYYDTVTIHTAGTYTVTTTSNLVITDTADGVSFGGQNYPDIPGQTGLTSFTQQQADASVLYAINNLSQVSFTYSVALNDPPRTSGRNSSGRWRKPHLRWV